jgi:hypothetical protein
MKKITRKKLNLFRETLVALDLGRVPGGYTYSACPSISCGCCSDFPHCPLTP